MKNKVLLTEGETAALQILNEPGWTGGFTRQQACGALFRNDSRVSKTKSEPGDTNLEGATGTVLGSIYHPALGFLYFVEWDNKPRHAVAVVGWRLGRAPS